MNFFSLNFTSIEIEERGVKGRTRREGEQGGRVVKTCEFWANVIFECPLSNDVHKVDEWFMNSKMRKHCVKSDRVRSYSGPHFSRIFPHSDWIRISPYSFRMREKSGKNADQNNSEYGHFLSSLHYLFQKVCILHQPKLSYFFEGTVHQNNAKFLITFKYMTTRNNLHPI